MNVSDSAQWTDRGKDELLKLPYRFAKQYGVVVESRDDAVPLVHCSESGSPLAILEIQRYYGGVAGLEIHPQAIFERILHDAYTADRSSSSEIAVDLEGRSDLRSLVDQLPPPEDLLDEDGDAPIISLLNALLAEAIRLSASDVHLEPYADQLIARLRVDGVLREVLTLDVGLAPLIASRVKVMARLDIAEKRVPQDGRIAVQSGDRQVDLRVSTLPSAHGERVVMRILDQQASLLRVDQLGLTSRQSRDLDALIQKPNGILLVTGPTGSGKTTTLYALLSRLNDRSTNIMTVEDPVEYHLPGVGQTQVNPKVGLDFARGLRAILRQDPDVVMVGEIRDLETAKTSIQASLTGHLVLSTLHTNTAIGAASRLRDMGIESYQLAAGLSGLIAQRLVRELCPQCKVKETPSEVISKQWKLGAEESIYRAGEGCAACDYTGYRGRLAVFEVVAVDDSLRQLIHDDAPESELIKAVRSYSEGLRESGRVALLAGKTSVDELVRIVD